VTLESLGRAWNRFFFAPTRPTPVALFRIAFGILVILDLVLLRPEWLTWFGPRGLVSLKTMHEMAAGWRINLFDALPPTDGSANAIFWILLVAAALVTVGFLTRLSSAVVFVGLASLHQRNLFITHAGDTLLRISGFFLVFAPAGAALSVDRLLRIWRGVETAEIRPRAPWAQRMMQIQTALVYFSSFWVKSQGSYWIDGTAMYYVYHLEQLQRFPLPSFVMMPAVIKLSGWLTLMIEFALGVLVWFKDIRYSILLCGLLLHMFIEYSMNIPLFEWIMISTYINFVYPEDLTRAWRWVSRRPLLWLPAPMTVTYDGRAEKVVRAANLLRALDVFDRLRFVELDAADAASGASRKEPSRLVVLTPSGPREGWSGLQFAARALPLLWLLALPGLVGGYLKPATRG
jgi:hypothetical protein